MVYIKNFIIGEQTRLKRQDITFAWQARFCEHIIRNNDELVRITLYIKNNPANWKWDGVNTDGT